MSTSFPAVSADFAELTSGYSHLRNLRACFSIQKILRFPKKTL